MRKKTEMRNKAENIVIHADVPAINREYAGKHVQRHNMAGFRAPKIDTVRVGVIGMRRGANHVKALVQLEGVEIRAICDKRPEIVEAAMVWFKDADHKPEIYTDGVDDWKRLCEQPDLDLDLIYVCSPIPLPQDVYDAAALSAMVPLTSWSAQNRSSPIDIPDFTCGAWKTNPRNMDINLETGGGNTRILPPSKAAMEFDDELAKQWARDHELKGES